MVRVRIKVKARKGASPASEVETVAIANTGFGAEGSEVVIPEALARRIGFLPELPQGTRLESYISASGPTQVHFIPQALDIAIITGDRTEGPIVADAVVISTDEVLLSDAVIEGFEIVLEKPLSGLWRFSDEPSSMLRRSEPPQEW